MKISYAICTHNEGDYIDNLISRLYNHAIGNSLDREIVIVDDNSTDEKTKYILNYIQVNYIKIPVYIVKRPLNRDFAEHKNFMNTLCSGKWILNLDADEIVSEDLLHILEPMINENPDVDAYMLPRINTVDGLTQSYVDQWGWVLSTNPDFIKVKTLMELGDEYYLLKQYNFIIDEGQFGVKYYQPIVCWPDYQTRLYINDPARIKWSKNVHETLSGYSKYAVFPDQTDYCIIHNKNIIRQAQQNTFYTEIARGTNG